MPNLSEDEIDDILYFARANEVDELTVTFTSLAEQYKCEKREIFSAAVDAESKNTALHYAGANGHVDILTLLISISSPSESSPIPHLNTANSSGNTPLHWASLNGHLSFVKELIKLGADASLVNAAGHDALFEAELNDKEEVLGWLLEHAEGLEQGVKGEERQDDEAALEHEGETSTKDKSVGDDAVLSVSEGVERISMNPGTKNSSG